MIIARHRVLRHVLTREEFDRIINESHLAVVYFTGASCAGRYEGIEEEFQLFSREFPRIKFIESNADKNPEIPESRNISTLPTFKFFKEGQPFGEDLIIGANVGEDLIVANVMELLKKIQELEDS